MKNNTSGTVVACYDILDVCLAGGIKDFTDGMYFNRDLPYEKAQQNQVNWLLNQVKCKKGSYVLDVGCGNGRLLEVAKERGAEAIGITISEKQVVRNNGKGLFTVLMNYRNIPDNWTGYFDGIIANGSIEHFVSIEEAVWQDKIYEKMFDIFHRVLRPNGRLATTVIHFNQAFDWRKIARGAKAYKRGSDNYHMANLVEYFGGWYPTENQLERCAEGLFKLELRDEGTQDYCWTSEYWLSVLKKQIARNPKVWSALSKKFAKYPRETLGIMDTLLVSQSWMWQFRVREDGTTPMVLYRDVWKKI